MLFQQNLLSLKYDKLWGLPRRVFTLLNLDRGFSRCHCLLLYLLLFMIPFVCSCQVSIAKASRRSGQSDHSGQDSNFSHKANDDEIF